MAAGSPWAGAETMSSWARRDAAAARARGLQVDASKPWPVPWLDDRGWFVLKDS